MSDVPKFTKRVANDVKSMISAASKDLPRGTYMPVIGWEVGFDKDFDDDRPDPFERPQTAQQLAFDRSMAGQATGLRTIIVVCDDSGVYRNGGVAHDRFKYIQPRRRRR